MDIFRLKYRVIDEVSRTQLCNDGFVRRVYSASVIRDADAILDSLRTVVIDGVVSAPINEADIIVALELLRALGIKNI